MKQQPVVKHNSKMHIPLIVTLCLCISVSQVLSQANTYEYSEQKPWSFVYTLYPFYDSETVLEIWKSDKTADTSTNEGTLGPDDNGQTVSYSDDNQRNNTNLKSQTSVPYFLNEAKSVTEEQLSRNKQRLTSYRNRHKDLNSQNE